MKNKIKKTIIGIISLALILIASNVFASSTSYNYNNCYISSFTSSNNYVNAGSTVYLSWNTNNCISVNISGIGNVSSSGSMSVYLNNTTVYTLNAYGSNGSRQSKSLYINVNNYYNNYNNYNYNNNCYIFNFSANKTSVKLGSPVTLIWNTNNCTSANITNLGNLNSSGSKIIYPSQTTTYTLRAYGYRSGAQSKSISIYVNNTNPVITQDSCVVTTVATNIEKNSATVNGFITKLNSSGSQNNSISNYFEYGKTVNLGLKTNPLLLGSGNTLFNKSLSNLKPNTIYYYRTVSNCNGEINKGDIKIFKTLKNPTNNTVKSKTTTIKTKIKQGKTITGVYSPVMLKIENKYKTIGKGDIVEYVITYKNIGKTELINPILQVIVSKHITITNTSKGTYSEDTKTLTTKLNNLKKGEEGTLYVQGQVISDMLNTNQIVSTALLVYTNTNKAQENAIAYVLNTPRVINNNNTNNISLGATALFGGFGSLGLIGLLLTIILILVIILIVRSYFYKHPIK